MCLWNIRGIFHTRQLWINIFPALRKFCFSFRRHSQSLRKQRQKQIRGETDLNNFSTLKTRVIFVPFFLCWNHSQPAVFFGPLGGPTKVQEQIVNAAPVEHRDTTDLRDTRSRPSTNRHHPMHAVERFPWPFPTARKNHKKVEFGFGGKCRQGTWVTDRSATCLLKTSAF